MLTPQKSRSNFIIAPITTMPTLSITTSLRRSARQTKNCGRTNDDARLRKKRRKRKPRTRTVRREKKLSKKKKGRHFRRNLASLAKLIP